MPNDTPVPAMVRAPRPSRPDDTADAEALVAEWAPGEAPVRWVGGREDEATLLWVATEGRVLLLVREYHARKVTEVRYTELHEVHWTRDRQGARVRLYAAGRKFALEGADPTRAEGFVQWVRDRLPSRAAYAPPLAGPPAPPPAAQGRLASLADVARLLDRGVLNEAEFAALKRRLLGG